MILILTLTKHGKGLHQESFFRYQTYTLIQKNCPRGGDDSRPKSDGTGAITVASSDCPYEIKCQRMGVLGLYKYTVFHTIHENKPMGIDQYGPYRHEFDKVRPVGNMKESSNNDCTSSYSIT